MDIASHIVNFNSQTNGRDKLCRVFQYSSKFIWWYLGRSGKNEDLMRKFQILENQLSSTRKVLRFGKSLDMLQGALKSITLKDAFLRMTLTMVKLNQAGYLLLDHLVWLGKVGVVETNTKRWARVSARFWMISIMFNIFRNIYDIYCIIHREIVRQNNMKKRSQLSGDYQNVVSSYESRSAVFERCLRDNKPVVLDCVKNAGDLVLPLSSLGYIQTSAGFQGFAGVISSLIGMAVVWDPILKLVPS